MHTEKITPHKQAFLGLQMLFVAFGALVLVPLLTGLNPNTALLTAGIGTLLFQLITKRQVPIFLASSFAFIAPIQYGVQTWGIPVTLGALACSGLVYVILSTFVKLRGNDILMKLFPPVVVGPIIIIIGLSLAPVAVNMATGKATGTDYNTAIIISMTTLLVTLIVSVFAKGILRLIPILCAITVGYILSIFMGIVDFTKIIEAPWFAMPQITTPEFKLEAILYMLPIAIAPAIEHIGDMMAISQVTNKNFLKKPGLNRTLLGDGVATIAASFLGGPPNTTYSEVTGAVMLTKNFNPKIMTWAAVFAILMAFVGKIGAFLQTIPAVVMGGIMMLVFGAIAVVGINSLIKNNVDLNQPRNLCIVSVVLTFGIGGMLIDVGFFAIKGIALCAVIAIAMNLLLPQEISSKQESDDIQE
ncbi:uracil-xanthine permease family protein [Pasteurella skyensis]|uniref:Uracil-xanthine permease family protein n=1 Tax=Phocoenobacter skyensis TaxID=97481 RepID=A0AAJ6NA54_9PAST|nr:uracil-xanthine permease family protein [Pasteurella skyensis]MDP8163132.1 uracil-xanthine permease family protein [Pasteurella skyensis]MDP8173047.1 uracil-xanthine permease family protein [Pasteurella skyensis]MDP8177145.1 uracil-xanthine permease family protein [Pasteurella skyensis]MDP8179609.1 uracil-xanthine permease family protein [Pasteurella skyensis]MDP8183798.1 uracil-xanthine permease family protein [Pasteurella skyensis]